MAEIEVLNSSGMTINKVVSDDIKTIDGDIYLTKEAANELYKSKSDGTSSPGAVIVSEYDYTPDQEQKIQFSLNEPYTVMMNGWFVVNPEPSNVSENWTISIDDRVMFHSDNDGNMTVSTLVKTGQVITSNATSSKNGYFMPCKPELRDWRDSSLKSDADIWKNAVTSSGEVVDQWLENSSSSSWYATHSSTYRNTLSYIKDDEAFDVNGNHLFYIQSENIKTGFGMFYNFSSLTSFSGDLSSLTNGHQMFLHSALESFNGDLSSLTTGSQMFRSTTLKSFSGDLPSLTNGNKMFYLSDIESFNGNLSSLSDGYMMFAWAAIQSFNGDLSSLTNGGWMFYDSALESFNGDLSSLEDGDYMFYHSAIQSFNGDLSKLIYGYQMFRYTALQSFSGDLSSLTDGRGMFQYTALESFSSDLSSLEDGSRGMFDGCKLNLESVQNIANTINTVSSGTLDLGVASSLNGNSDLNTALAAIRAKGWTVNVGYNS